MNKNRKRMAGELLVWVVAGLLLSMGLFFGLRIAFADALAAHFERPEVIAKQEKAIVDSLQRFIDERGLAFSDTPKLNAWAKQNEDWIVTLYRENIAIYSSYSQMQVQVLPDEEIAAGMNGRTIRFADGVAHAIGHDFGNRYYNRSQLAAAGIAFLSFLGIVLMFIRRKLRVIATLESELKILGGGDLSYPISITGNDELTSLAEEIDAMRTSVLERQENERAAIAANRDLVTAMSHDLRTPLTSLIGYLEILRRDPKTSPEQSSLAEAALGKAEHIKGLSDRLFAHFLVTDADEATWHRETMKADDFLDQFVGEAVREGEANKRRILWEGGSVQGSVRVDPQAMRRVFDNLQSNLEKYADLGAPVRWTHEADEKNLTIRLTNAKRSRPGVESSGIGLRSCKKILAQHGGEFSYADEDVFETIVRLPLVR